MEGKNYPVGIISNITVNQIKEVFEYTLRSAGIKANCTVGNYDNIVQDAGQFKQNKLVVIFWELANLVDGLQYKAELLEKKKTEELIEKVKAEIAFVFQSLNETSHVLINKFSSLTFNYSILDTNNLDYIADSLNQYLIVSKPKNVTIVDIDKVLAKLSIEKSVDLRYYYSSKALYTIEFFKAYANFTLPVVRSLNGKAKKALIFDCDNTLWKGILGEDGIDEIRLSSQQSGGTAYEEVQSLAKALTKEGVVLGLCSKNNPDDIEEVLENHPGMTLKNSDLTIKKVNWNDKVSSLNEIAASLNIGTDSFVFIDDSDFEINFVKENLPEITTLQVPAKTFEYPGMLRENLGLFYSVSKTGEDLKRVTMYKEQAQREEAKSGFGDLEEYIKSLDIRIDVHVDDPGIVPRVSQMTQKTNQFNLTTKRYSEADISRFIDDPSNCVFAIGVSDKFGDNGVTGLAIVNLEGDTAEIDTLLMSCRIIGRRIEFRFFDFIVEYLKKTGIHKINAQYLKTLKNEQVIDFFHILGFEIINKQKDLTNYTINIENYKSHQINYMLLSDEK